MAFGLSELQYLMHQLGPSIPEIVTILQEDIDSWELEFDEGVSMRIDWHEAPSRIVMSCSIGRADESARERVYAALLEANLQLTGVASVKLALGPDDDVMLIGEFDPDDATIDALRDKVAEFLEFAAKFSSLVTGADAPAADDPASTDPMPPDPSPTDPTRNIHRA